MPLRLLWKGGEQESMEEEQKTDSRSDGERQENGQKTPPPEPARKAGCLMTSSDHGSHASHRNFMQADVLDRGPDNREATGLRREDVDLIGALTNVTEETLDGIGGPDVPVHRLRKIVKGESLLLLLGQAPHSLWIAFAIFGFEGSQLGHCLLFAWLIPDPNELGLNLPSLSSRDGIEHMTLFME